MMSRCRHLLLALMLSGCSDYRLEKNEPRQPAVDESDSGSDPDTDEPTDGEQPPTEDCNGVDDDGDGEVDEDYVDLDEDGIADCVDEDCEATAAVAAAVEVDRSCSFDDVVVSDPWDVQVEWRHRIDNPSTGVVMLPSIGQLTDDNGDGVIDEGDIPDIAFTTGFDDRLVALQGDGSAVLFELAGFDGRMGPAIADVDRDGVPEVIAWSDTGLKAVSGSGAELWSNYPLAYFGTYVPFTITDLTGDGEVEIITGGDIVRGSDGSLVSISTGSPGASWLSTVAADLDADGAQESLFGSRTCSIGINGWYPDCWRIDLPEGADTAFAAVADIDGDPGGESFWVAGQRLLIIDDDGSLIREVALHAGSRRPGPPAVADFDGDGVIEVAVPATSLLEVFEIDGTPLWSASIVDISGVAGCSGFDLDGDGAYEVLYAGETDFQIFDGRTGTLRFEYSTHSSGTVSEYPLVADVDADGAAEIILASYGSGWKGITVLGHPGGGWPGSGGSWPVHDYAVTNINEDGSVPTPVPRSWTTHNLFRARPAEPGGPAVDLVVEIVDVCHSGCRDESRVELEVQVRNQGTLRSREGLSLALYGLNGGVETLLDVQLLPGPVESGQALASLHFAVQRSDMGDGGLRVRVDDDGTGTGRQDECDESNNTDTYADGPC